MANEEHLTILKQGVRAWNRWREENREVIPDLGAANLAGADLTGATLSNMNLNDANLKEANLSRASLNASHCIMTNATGANLSGTDLSGTDFSRATLRNVDFTEARLFQTIFADTILSGAVGLETCVHESSSIIDHLTLATSGPLPAVFLRGCGLPDWLMEAYTLVQPDLNATAINDVLYRVFDKRASQAVQISPLFISYNHQDAPFIDHLEPHFNDLGIRFWRDRHHATAGRLEKVVDRAIRLNPTVLLVLSEHSVRSDWIQHEVRLARQLEIETGRDVLCPVALDGSWKRCRWPERLREQVEEYNILDFSNWRAVPSFTEQFDRLLRGLRIFYE